MYPTAKLKHGPSGEIKILQWTVIVISNWQNSGQSVNIGGKLSFSALFQSWWHNFIQSNCSSEKDIFYSEMIFTLILFYSEKYISNPSVTQFHTTLMQVTLNICCYNSLPVSYRNTPSAYHPHHLHFASSGRTL